MRRPDRKKTFPALQGNERFSGGGKVNRMLVVAVALLSVVPVLAGGIVVTDAPGSAPGSVIQIGAGRADGVREGMTASILDQGGAASDAVGAKIAQVKIASVSEHTSSASVLEITKGKAVRIGCSVVDFKPALESKAIPGAAATAGGKEAAAKKGEGEAEKVKPQGATPPAAGETWTNPKDGLVYVYIPPGTFQMGCVPGDAECAEIEKPAHPVQITRGFWMGRTEVTVGAYQKFCTAMGRDMPPAPRFNPGWQYQDHPIVNVSWDDARDYCEWVGGRLPTEAEREYAARGGKGGTIFTSGNTISHEDANFGLDYCCGPLAQGRDRWEYTAPVGSFPPNDFGLFDMTGNVWEWCSDWYGGAYYRESPPADPAGPASGPATSPARIGRGGGWTSHAWLCRLSQRSGFIQKKQDPALGFRALLGLERPGRGEKPESGK
jgi:formylglycine-generating enzyme required for sulfatase activity